MADAEAFRALALALSGAREIQILGSQEFRIKDRAFATLGWPEPGWAVVRLSVADQARFLKSASGLSPEVGPRGRRGVTRLHLARLDDAVLETIIQAAWRHLTALPAGQPGG